jgi:hypothetical protein
MSRVLGGVLHDSSLFFTEKQLLQKTSDRAPPQEPELEPERSPAKQALRLLATRVYSNKPTSNFLDLETKPNNHDFRRPSFPIYLYYVLRLFQTVL